MSIEIPMSLGNIAACCYVTLQTCWRCETL